MEYQHPETRATEEEKRNGWKDPYGVLFSADRKKLIKANMELTEYRIPDGVETICCNAFLICRQLKSVTLPPSVRVIGEWAFNCCSSLTHIELNEGLQTIEKNIFINCPALKELTLPKTLVHIGHNPCPGNSLDRLTCLSPHFKVCNNMLLTADGRRLISYFGKESQVVVPQGVEEIGNVAFLDLPNLTEVSLPDSLTRIGAKAFAGCKELNDINLPHSLIAIGDYAFQDSSISFLTLPPLLSEMGANPFKSTIPFFLNSYSPHFVVRDHSLYTADGTKLISYWHQAQKEVLPEGLQQIDHGAFGYHFHLEQIQLPSTLTTIGQEAFALCFRLQTINLPPSLQNIGHMAFTKCNAMQQIVIPPHTKEHYAELLTNICCEEMIPKLTEQPTQPIK